MNSSSSWSKILNLYSFFDDRLYDGLRLGHHRGGIAETDDTVRWQAY